MITKRYLTGGINGTTHAYNSTTALVGDTTAFDRAGNKLYERHLEAESRSHLYQPFNADGSFGAGYDSANRLLQYQRGVLSNATIPYRVNPGASISTPTTLPGADQVRTYGLDGLGNWKTSNFTLVGSGGSTTSTAEARQHNYVNEIMSVRDTTGGTPTTTPFAYDHGNNTDGIKGNGNLVNDGVRKYQYDGFNRLIQVSNASGTVLATYQYDAFDRCVVKTVADLGGGFGGLTGDVPAGATHYYYDDKQIVEQRNDAAPDVWTQVNFWGQYIDELLFFTVPTATTYRVLSDLLYRSVATVTTANVVTEAYDCDAYGNTLCYSGPGTDGLWFTDDDVTTNNPINSTIFTGRQYDPESQIYYYRARYFSPNIGRFISRDPLENAELSQGPNLYWYVQDSPPNAADSKGLSSCCCACVNSISIKNIQPYSNRRGLFGHDFDVNISITYVKSKKQGNAKLSWQETVDNTKLLSWQNKNKKGASNNMAALYPTSPTFAPWTNRNTSCKGPWDVTIKDVPGTSLQPPNERTLNFEIIVESAANCPCSNQSVEVTATQVLEVGPNGKIIRQSFTTP